MRIFCSTVPYPMYRDKCRQCKKITVPSDPRLQPKPENLASECKVAEFGFESESAELADPTLDSFDVRRS